MLHGDGGLMLVQSDLSIQMADIGQDPEILPIYEPLPKTETCALGATVMPSLFHVGILPLGGVYCPD